MTPERWQQILSQSSSLGPVRSGNEMAARGAVRVQLAMSANAGDGPVGVLTDRRYLVPDPPPPSGQSPQSKTLVRMHAERKGRDAHASANLPKTKRDLYADLAAAVANTPKLPPDGE